VDGSYHVALGLDREQSKILKLLAVSRGISVRELLTKLALAEIERSMTYKEEQQ